MKALTGLGAIGRILQNDARAPEMPLGDILPDPDNPREPFEQRTPEEQHKQLQLNQDVAERGVKAPISIHPHPTIAGKWVINAGHCRYEAAVAAKQATIPCFVDEKFDDYDQVNENELRSNLSPWSLAAFIARKVKQGQSKGDIAARLRKNQNVITEYLALVDPPACLRSAYTAGVRSPRTLYDLRRAWDEYPEQVDALVSSGTKITRETIKDLTEKLRHDVIAAPGMPPSSELAEPQQGVGQVLRHDVKTEPANDAAIQPPAPPAPPVDRVESPRAESPAVNPKPDQEPTKLRHDVKTPKEPEAPLASPKPSTRADGIMVQYKGKTARIAPGTTVRIVLDGVDAAMDVPLSELVFKGAK